MVDLRVLRVLRRGPGPPVPGQGHHRRDRGRRLRRVHAGHGGPHLPAARRGRLRGRRTALLPRHHRVRQRQQGTAHAPARRWRSSASAVSGTWSCRWPASPAPTSSLSHVGATTSTGRGTRRHGYDAGDGDPAEALQRRAGWTRHRLRASDAVVAQAVRATRPGGTFVLGVNADPGTLPFAQEKVVVGSLLGTRRQMREVLKLAAAGKIKAHCQPFALATRPRPSPR